MATSKWTLDRLPEVRQSRSNLLVTILGAVDSWIERHRQRHALLGLNDAMLKDIGISRADADREGSKPFWSA